MSKQLSVPRECSSHKITRIDFYFADCTVAQCAKERARGSKALSMEQFQEMMDATLTVRNTRRQAAKCK